MIDHSLPSGTVTFLFTDIEGSTKRWEQLPGEMAAALRRHDLLLRTAIEEHAGYVFKTIGDAFCAVFADPDRAIAAALSAQRFLATEPWGEVGPVRVRMALHTGEPEHRERDYFGPPVNRVARILSTGYGEQVLVSSATAAAVRDRLPDGAVLHDLGAHRLKDLLQPERIYQLVASGQPAEFPPLKSLDRQPHNLPAQSTPLVGREDEVAQARSLVEADGTRLVTLIGPGGTGKTRLGLQIAAELIEVFADGAWFVPLASVADPDLVVAAVATALGVREAGHEPLERTLLDYLRDRQLLLVLDNFEQLVSAAPAVGRLLTACPRLKMLVTSRTALRVYGEREIPVPPLRLPNLKKLPPLAELVKVEAVELFVERAMAVKPGFTLSEDNARSVAEICVKLEGLPLAVELAAARVRVLPPGKLLDRLTKRLDLLTGGASDRDSRQQTLRGAIAWSHDLLSRGERQLFRRLSVFVGGCGFETAEQVCNADGRLGIDVLDGLESLVQKSLLRQSEGLEGDPRFSMLETIREFGLEQLEASGERAEMLRAHADFFLDFAETADPELEQGRDQGMWLDRLELDCDNLRTALQSFIDAEGSEEELRLAIALGGFWSIRGHLSEGRGWFTRILERSSDAKPESRARALGRAAALCKLQGDFDESKALFLDALNLYDEIQDERNAARTLANLGLLAIDQGEYDVAEQLFQSGLDAARSAGDTREISRCLNLLGMLAFHRGDYEQAAGFYDQCLSISRQLRDDYYLATALVNLAEVHQHRGDLARATTLYRDALPLTQKLGDKYAKAFALFGLGRLQQLQGDVDPAKALLLESLSLSQELGDKVSITGCLEALAGVYAAHGNELQAARLFGAAEIQREALSAPIPDVYRQELDTYVAAARSNVGDLFFTAAWHEGRALTLEQAISEAFAINA